MLDMPPAIANIAQDIRINIDLLKSESADRFYLASGRDATPSELLASVKTYLNELATTSVSMGCAMNIEDYKKYDGLSEEAIGALLMKDWKDAPELPNREVSFEKIMEGAAEEAKSVKIMITSGVPLAPTPVPYNLQPVELSGLEQDLISIGRAKANPAKIPDKMIRDAADLLVKLKEHQGLVERDIQHSRGSMAQAGKGTVHTSGKTGDAYLDALKPSERVDLAIQVLEQILQPQAQNGLPQKPQNGGMTIKDLERNRKGSGQSKQKNQGAGQSQDAKASGDKDTVPSPNVYHDTDHVMSTSDLVDILQKAGLSQSSMEKLGYDDLDTIANETRATKDGVVNAINKASEDQMRLGNRMPGGHLLNYAKAQMIDFFKPVLTWEMSFKKIIDGAGRGSRHAPDEPWTIYHVDASDMGFKRQDEVPYMGSRMPGKEQKPLVFVPIDTSGSVDDAMLKRFVTESINMARKVSRGVAPDVVIVFADTVARGDPVFVNEKNYKEFLAKGINYGGRGGTSFQASLENIFELVKPGAKSGYAKRKIDAIVYMTDTGDSVPDPKRLHKKAVECGMKDIPTTLFLAPKSCFNDYFNKGIKQWADIVWFDTAPGARQAIKMDEIASKQQSKTRKLTS
jgi:hypothetical protein